MAPRPLAPHDFWQAIDPAGTHDPAPAGGFAAAFPARLSDGRQLLLPIRALPDGSGGVASLIVNQASFAVHEALTGAMAALVAPLRPEIVAGLPTLGLTLAKEVAQRLGHERFVPFGTSRKFWYREELSEPLTSITSPGQAKRLYLDPRLLPLIEGRRLLLVDDVVSTGTSMAAALKLMAKAGASPAGVAVAMRQTERWRTRLSAEVPAYAGPVLGAFDTPLLERRGESWFPTE